MNNKKGSPARLGKPAPGDWRCPTSGEVEYCGLRRFDHICVDADTGHVFIKRSVPPYGKGQKRERLEGNEADCMVVDLYDYWAR